MQQTQSPSIETSDKPSGYFEPSNQLSLNTATNYAMFALDSNGHITQWNSEAQRIIGYAFEEIVGQHFSLCYSHEDQRHHLPQRALETALEEGHFVDEGWRTRKDGSHFWASMVVWPIRDHSGRMIGFNIVTHDITDRREAEEKLRRNNERLQLLTARLAEVETAERRQLAHELHDRAGQNLTALGINLNIIRSQLSQESATNIGTRLDDCLVLLEDTTERIRDVMATLRPQVLEDYGLIAALHWYAESFSLRTEIPVTVIADETEPQFARHIQDTLYRIVLEALNNVAKHAQATSLIIKFSVASHKLQIEIIDDGIGFDPNEELISIQSRHWGLQTMVERIEAIGGTLGITSAPGAGTRIVVGLPL